MTTKEEQRKAYNDEKELENLRRVFDSMDRNRDQKIDSAELMHQLARLEYKPKKAELEDMIWEVDEDCDKCVSWDEFRTMFNHTHYDEMKAKFDPHGAFPEVYEKTCKKALKLWEAR